MSELGLIRTTEPAASTTQPRAQSYATFMWGVEAQIDMAVVQDIDAMCDCAARSACDHKLAAPGDVIVVVAGVPLGSGAGMTNLIKIQVVGAR